MIVVNITSRAVGEWSPQPVASGNHAVGHRNEGAMVQHGDLRREHFGALLLPRLWCRTGMLAAQNVLAMLGRADATMSSLVAGCRSTRVANPTRLWLILQITAEVAAAFMGAASWSLTDGYWSPGTLVAERPRIQHRTLLRLNVELDAARLRPRDEALPSFERTADERLPAEVLDLLVAVVPPVDLIRGHELVARAEAAWPSRSGMHPDPAGRRRPGCRPTEMYEFDDSPEDVTALRAADHLLRRRSGVGAMRRPPMPPEPGWLTVLGR